MTRATIRLGLLVMLVPPARASDQPAKVAAVGIEQRLGEQVPADLPFRDDSGREVRLGDCFGEKPVVLILGYYRCPRLCSLALIHLVDSLRQLDEEKI